MILSQTRTSDPLNENKDIVPLYGSNVFLKKTIEWFDKYGKIITCVMSDICFKELNRLKLIYRLTKVGLYVKQHYLMKYTSTNEVNTM